jgi:UDP-GlcNAc:undecaprenyl-phosphate GlcNAc-1-phosphate transferase
VRYLVLAATAAALSVLATPLVRALAIRLRAMDEPGARRVHTTAIPRLGGLAVLAACLLTLTIAPLLGVEALALLGGRGWHLGWLLAGVGLMAATGAVDDVRGIDARAKLLLQAAAAGLALAGGYGLRGFTNPFTGGYSEFGALGGLLTVVWIVGITNAFNLIDGLDGLAAGVGLIVSATLLVVSLMEGRIDSACLWATLLGGLAGFLVYNFNPASIFLGDAGSLPLGYLIAVLAIQSLQKGATAVVVLVPLLALGLPIMEVAVTLLRRTFLSGVASVFRADRDHFHHRLLRRGMTHRGAVLTLYAACLAFCLLAFIAVVVQGPANALVIGVAAIAMYAAIRMLGYRVPRKPGV